MKLLHFLCLLLFVGGLAQQLQCPSGYYLVKKIGVDDVPSGSAHPVSNTTGNT
jgi:hypothetical protein